MAFQFKYKAFTAVAVGMLCLIAGTAMLADALVQEHDDAVLPQDTPMALSATLGDNSTITSNNGEINLAGTGEIDPLDGKPGISGPASAGNKKIAGDTPSDTPKGTDSQGIPPVAPVPLVSTRFQRISEPAPTQPQPNPDTAPPPTPTPIPASELPYLIYVSKHSFTIAILGKDDSGEYTVLLHTFHTAVGRTSGQTRAGNYTISGREQWHRWGTNSYSPYTTQHSGGLYFHGPVYTERDSYALKAASYNEIGTNATSGCLRTYTSAAAWIYYNCPTGTPVIIANDSMYTSTSQPDIDLNQNFDPSDPDVS